MADFDAILDKDFKSYLDALETASPVEVRGRVTEVTGLVVKAVIPGVSVGELCHIKVHHRNKPVRAEVVGFKDEHVFLMPLGSLEGIGPGSEVVPSGHTLTVRVGPRLLGRVLTGLGDPMDHKGDLVGDDFVDYPVMQPPPDPLERQRILKHIEVGVRAIDATLTCGEGQRIGVFAAAGVGKSTLLGMIARNTEAEVSVICLIGERGREVRDPGQESIIP